MELGVHQKSHCLREKQNSYTAYILTTKNVSINKTRNRSKKMLYFCLLMWSPKINTTSKHSMKSTLQTTQLQRLKHKPRNLILVQGQKTRYIMTMKEHQLWLTLLKIQRSNLLVQIFVPNGGCTMVQEVQ